MPFFAPLDSKNELRNVDTSETNVDKGFYANLSHDRPGPFGYLATSFTVNLEVNMNNGVAKYSPLDITPDFTHAFFFRTESSPSANEQKPIYQIGLRDRQSLIVLINPPEELEIRINDIRGKWTGTLTSFNRLINPNAWHFLAISVDSNVVDEKDRLAVYYANNTDLYKRIILLKNATAQINDLDLLINTKHLELNLGYGMIGVVPASGNIFPKGITELETISCFSVYSKFFDESDVRGIIERCRMEHESSSIDLEGNKQLPHNLSSFYCAFFSQDIRPWPNT